MTIGGIGDDNRRYRRWDIGGIGDVGGIGIGDVGGIGDIGGIGIGDEI